MKFVRRNAIDDPVGDAKRLISEAEGYLEPNVIPPKPEGLKQAVTWAETTFAPGTPVKFTRVPNEEREAFAVADEGEGGRLEWGDALPRGARGETLDYEISYVSASILLIPVKITDARDAYGKRIDDLIGLEGYFDDSVIEPLVDNWAQYQSARGVGRHRLPASQRARMKPNAGPLKGAAMDTGFGQTLDDPDSEGGAAVDAAMDRYEIFHDKAPIRIAELDHDFPKRWVKTGEALSVMYRTDKWQKDGTDEDYKHLHDDGDDKPYPLGKGVKFYEPASQASKSTVGGSRRRTSESQRLPVAVPKALTLLGYSLGFFVRRDDDEEIYELNPRGTWLFSSPSGNLLAVYSPTDGFLGAMVGAKLRVLKDGIDG